MQSWALLLKYDREPNLILTKTATIIIGGKRNTNNDKETNKSKSLFIYNHTPNLVYVLTSTP